MAVLVVSLVAVVLVGFQELLGLILFFQQLLLMVAVAVVQPLLAIPMVKLGELVAAATSDYEGGGGEGREVGSTEVLDKIF